MQASSFDELIIQWRFGASHKAWKVRISNNHHKATYELISHAIQNLDRALLLCQGTPLKNDTLSLYTRSCTTHMEELDSLMVEVTMQCLKNSFWEPEPYAYDDCCKMSRNSAHTFNAPLLRYYVYSLRNI